MGGWTKIDSVQNVITLRGDLRDAWVNYEFGVDPNVSPSSVRVAYYMHQELYSHRIIIASLHLQMAMQILTAGIFN
jgi:hypothetical protein